MNIGNLNKRITILKRTLVDDGFTEKEAYTPFKTVWASVEYLADGERIRASMASRNIQLRFIIRASKSFSLDNTYQIRFNGSIYDIDGAKPVGNAEEFIEVTVGKQG